VHDNGEVSLHVSLDISNVIGQVNLGGINQPIIGQRKMEHDIRLREGEVSLLGGLLNQSNTKTKTGIPWLASIPILGRLFSGDSVDNERDELMIALIPHVVRRPEITEENLRSVASGNQTTIHVSYAPKPVEEAAAPKEAPLAAPAQAPPANAMPLGAPGTPPPAANPVVIPAAAPAQAPGGFGPPATAPPEAGPGAPQPLAGPVTVRFDATQLEKSLSDSFTISLQVDGARNVIGAPIQIQFDPKAVSLTGVTRGSFWGGEGEEPMLTKNVLNDSGSATIRVSRKEGSAGITGNGPLINLTFKAQARGATIIRASSVTLESFNGPPASGSAQVTVNVK
jgi:general secretion pathway protein D